MNSIYADQSRTQHNSPHHKSLECCNARRHVKTAMLAPEYYRTSWRSAASNTTFATSDICLFTDTSLANSTAAQCALASTLTPLLPASSISSFFPLPARLRSPLWQYSSLVKRTSHDTGQVHVFHVLHCSPGEWSNDRKSHHGHNGAKQQTNKTPKTKNKRRRNKQIRNGTNILTGRARVGKRHNLVTISSGSNVRKNARSSSHTGEASKQASTHG